MATYNIQLSQKNADGSINKFNPLTKAANVSVTPPACIDGSNSTVQDVTSSLKELAFNDGSNVVFLSNEIGESSYDPSNMSEVDDNQTSESTTWSSSKISGELSTCLSYKIVN